MKKLIFLLTSLFILQTSAQTNLTADQWQEDLKFLQSTVHNDYSFLFKKTTVEDFDKAVGTLYKEIPNMQEHEIIVGLARIVSSFKYGHTALGFRSIKGVFHQLPINLYQFNDGVYVQGVHQNYKQALGAKVIAIEGVSVDQALLAIKPVVPVENEQYFKAYGLRYMIIPEVLHAQGVIKKLSNTVELTLKKEGKTFKLQFNTLPEGETVPTVYGFVEQKGDWLDARNQDQTPLYLKNLDKIYYFEYLPEDKTVYVRQSQVQDEPDENIPAFYTRVFDFIEKNDVEKLVIDVRLNGGGNNYKNKAVITRIIEAKKINKVGKFYVIIGRRTFSASQNLVNEIDNYTNAIFVGEPTAENINFYGDNRRIELPNSKIPAFLSFAWWQDKPQWENGPWTAPQLAIDMSFEEYQKNIDPVLETALNFDEEGFIIDPMAHLTKLYEEGNAEQIRIDVKKMVTDSRYKFFDFEDRLNQAGYQLIGDHQTEGAIFVFQLVTELFPDSANAWDSLAEGYLEAGQKDKAIEYFNKAIAMDPNGDTGKNARSMLKKIEEQK
jgi:tetratricopeptide (TPR) repeat protein